MFLPQSHLINPRYFTREKARDYGITGWCRNTTDNKVSQPVPPC